MTVPDRRYPDGDHLCLRRWPDGAAEDPALPVSRPYATGDDHATVVSSNNPQGEHDDHLHALRYRARPPPAR